MSLDDGFGFLLHVEAHQHALGEAFGWRPRESFGGGQGTAHGLVPLGVARAFFPVAGHKLAGGINGQFNFGHVTFVVQIFRPVPFGAQRPKRDAKQTNQWNRLPISASNVADQMR